VRDRSDTAIIGAGYPAYVAASLWWTARNTLIPFDQVSAADRLDYIREVSAATWVPLASASTMTRRTTGGDPRSRVAHHDAEAMGYSGIGTRQAFRWRAIGRHARHRRCP
jgi:hypothetical protein